MKSCRMCIIMCVQKRTSAWMSRSTRTRGGKGGHSYRNVVKSRLVCFSGRRWCSERHSTAAGRRLKTNTVSHTSNSSGVRRLFCNWLDRVFQYRRWRKPIGRREREMDTARGGFISIFSSFSFLFFFFFGGFVIEECVFVLHHRLYFKKKKEGKKAEVTSTITQTAHSRKVTKDSSRQFLHCREQKRTSVTSTTGYWVEPWRNHTFITRDFRTFSLQEKPSYSCFRPQWRRVQSAFILRSSDCTVVRCFY